MPLTASGKLTIVASSDLGGLGSRNGSPVVYDWAFPSVAPSLLPWLIVLGMLFLKPNRCGAAWLIWLPIICVMAMAAAGPDYLPGRINFFLDVIDSMAVGMAAIWLLSGYFPRRHRFITFSIVLLALAASSALAAVLRQGLSLISVQSVQIGFVLAAGVLASAAALSLVGLICRKRNSMFSLYLWLFVSVIAAWLLIAFPFFVIALVSSGGRLSFTEFLIPILATGAGNFALILPFLVLSSASPFFRERLKALVHVVPEAPPVVPPAVPETQAHTNPQPQQLS